MFEVSYFQFYHLLGVELGAFKDFLKGFVL